jgi:hypothetical protein
MDMLELKTALESANGPDTTLDLEVFRYFNPNRNHYIWQYGRPCLYLRFNNEWRAIEPDHYTESVDVAITLVPENFRIYIQDQRPYGNSKGAWHCGIDRIKPPFFGSSKDVFSVYAASIPLALCLARVEYELANAS